MAARANSGVPAKVRDQERVPDIYARRLTNRARALIEQAFDDLADRAKAGRGDFVKVLADQMLEDPMTALERLNKLLPQEQQAGASGAVNIGSLYLQAIQTANGHGSVAPMLDVTPSEPAEEW
jgi:hypothetical protein